MGFRAFPQKERLALTDFPHLPRDGHLRTFYNHTLRTQPHPQCSVRVSQSGHIGYLPFGFESAAENKYIALLTGSAGTKSDELDDPDAEMEDEAPLKWYE